MHIKTLKLNIPFNYAIFGNRKEKKEQK